MNDFSSTLSQRIYLDHAGATLPSTAQIEEISANLMSDIFRLGNPHSRHQSGETTGDITKKIRENILSHFGVTSEEYAVILTKNTSDSLKLMAEIVSNISDEKFQEPKLLLCQDSHTSVHGIRHQLKNWKTTVKSYEAISSTKKVDPFDLFIFTAMSNFSGKKYDPKIISKLKEANPHIQICIDLASLCGTSPINLQDFYNPDFVALSFYKIFGYPTGIGALLIRKTDDLKKVRPKGFFGGSVDFYNVETGDFISKQNFEEKFEIGTPNYHGIDLLRYGFKDLERFGGMKKIQRDTFELAKMAFKFFTETKHANDSSIAVVYGWDSESIKDQGPIVTFNLKRDDGSFVGYVEVEKMCSLFGIELRTGCFCNQGACNEYLGINLNNNNLQNVNTLKKCGDEMDLSPTGFPLGACRISFGRTSTIKDFEAFKTMIETCFISTTKLLTKLHLKFIQLNEKSKNVGKLTDLFFYPVKSCAAAKPKRWKLTKSGLWLDRQWIVVSGDGIVLTQKKLPALCNIIPQITENNTLQLSDRDGFQDSIELPLIENSNKASKSTTVCISNYMAISCGLKASKWLTNLHPTFPQTSQILRLLPETCDFPSSSSSAKEISSNQSSTFTNEADYLLITWASVKAIAETVNLDPEDVAQRFRPNFIVETFSDIPFEEDHFSKIWMGGIPFEITNKCTRCQMISIDQETGEKDPKVLLALRDARCGDKITFGVYLKRLTEKECDISIGSTVIIERN